MRKTFVVWVSILVIAVIASVTATTFYFRSSMKERLIVSTTTSLYDTGLLRDAIEPAFEAKYPIDLNFISVGTGIAIQHAQRGDADLILVHSPSDELGFLTNGTGVNRKIIAYNFFAIVGPKTDSAQIKGTTTLQALSKIVESGRNGTAKWISRGDNSGTHSKEKSLWQQASFNSVTLAKESSWYITPGGGMGDTLNKAEYFSAYTLADMGTYLAYSKEGRIPSLEVLVEQEKNLLNVYSAIAVNQTLHPNVNFEGAITFMKFLISDEGQQIIEEFGKDQYGQSLFYPAVQLLKKNTDPVMAQMIKEYAFFNDTECPTEYRKGHPELYG